MKKLTLLFVLLSSQAIGQDWGLHTKEMSVNGVIHEMDQILLDIDLTSQAYIKVGDEIFIFPLNPDDVIYSAFSNGSNIMIWEVVYEDGSRQEFVFNNDITSGKIDFCTFLPDYKICYLNLSHLE